MVKNETQRINNYNRMENTHMLYSDLFLWNISLNSIRNNKSIDQLCEVQFYVDDTDLVCSVDTSAEQIEISQRLTTSLISHLSAKDLSRAGDTEITPQLTLKFLGIILENKLSWNSQN